MPRKTGEKTNETLIKEMQMGDRKSFEEMINYYKSLAEKLATNYFDLGVEKEDIISSSLEGLVLGVNKLVTLGYTKNITQTIIRNINSTIEKNIIEYYGIYIYGDKSPFKNKIIEVLIAKRDLKKTLKRNPTPKEISEHTKINENEVKEILNFLFKHTNIEYSEFNSNNVNFLELEQDILNSEIAKKLIEENLSQKEKVVLHLYKSGYDCRDIALQLNISYQRVGFLLHNLNIKLNLIKSSILENKNDMLINYQNNKKTLTELLNMLLEGNLGVLEIIYNHFLKLYKNKIDKNIKDTLKDEEIDKTIKKAVNYSLRKNLISKRIDKSEIIRIIRDYLEELKILRAKKHNNKNKQKSINELLEKYKEKKDKKAVINKLLRKYKYYLENIIGDYLYLGVNTEEIYYITYKTIIFTIEYSIKNNIQNFEEVLKFYIGQSMIELFSNIYEIEIDNEILKIMRDIKEYEIKFMCMKSRRPTTEEIIKEVKIPSEKLEKIINILNINNNLEKPHLVPRLKGY